MTTKKEDVKAIKTFEDKVQEVKARVKNRSFSRTDFVSLFVAYLNDKDHIMEEIVYSDSKEEAITVMKKPVADFRKALSKMLVSAGLDKTDAEEKAMQYKFKESDFQHSYDLISEFLYQYMKTGRKLDLYDRQDASHSVWMKEQPAGMRDNGRGTTYKTEDYITLGQSSACPQWSKVAVDDKGNALKTLKRLTKQTF